MLSAYIVAIAVVSLSTVSCEGETRVSSDNATTEHQKVPSSNSTFNQTVLREGVDASKVEASVSSDNATTEDQNVLANNSTGHETVLPKDVDDTGGVASVSSDNVTTEDQKVPSSNSTFNQTVLREGVDASKVEASVFSDNTTTEDLEVPSSNSTFNQTVLPEGVDTGKGEAGVSSDNTTTEDQEVPSSNSTGNETVPPEDVDDDPATDPKYNDEGNCDPSGTHQRVRDGIVTLINHRRRELVEGKQYNGPEWYKPGEPRDMMPKGMFMREMGYNCELENEAIRILKEKCYTRTPPTAPNGTTGFFDFIEKPEGKSWEDRQWEAWGPGKWLSEIDQWGLDQDDSLPGRTIVLYGERNKDNCNLLRWDAYRIGCALNMCKDNNTINIFCLINKPPLRKGSIIYYAGNGTCPIGRCQYNLTCHDATGLCVEPNWISTTTTPVPTTTECFNGGSFWLAGFFYNWFGKDPCWSRWYPTTP